MRFALAFVLALAACSADDDEPELRAPRLDEAAEMTGAVHLVWTNAEPACDAVEVERKEAPLDGAPATAFAVVYSVPGAADNKHDASATQRAVYTYRLRCKKAARYSAYSNELSATPLP